MALQNELNRQVVVGEKVLISLPGSFGEALAVTERRVLVIRDCDSGGHCNSYAYLLSSVNGAEASSSASGGYIEVKLAETISDPEQARVYFPSYDANLFQTAAEEISALVSQASSASPAPSTAAASSVSVNASGIACPACGAAAEDRAIYCGQCGQQLRTVCAECGGASPVGSKFCITCGKKMTEYAPVCTKCGNRIQRWTTFCTECGSMQHQSCIACGSTIQSTWRHCGNCGRLLGSDEFDPRTSRQAQNRLQNFKESMEEPAAPVAQSAPEPATATSAAQHNDQGRELFDAEDLQGAIREFQKAVELEPNNGSYHCNLAVAYDENDQNELAFSEYNKALQIDPKDLTALLSLGYMYNEQDEYEKAEQVWRKILEIAPDTPEAQEVRQNLAHQGNL